MTAAQTIAILPLIVTGATAVLVMLMISFARNHKLIFGLSLAGLAAGIGCLFIAWPKAPMTVTPLLIIDRYALFYMGLILAATLMVVLVSFHYLEGGDRKKEEFYLLLLLATLGSMVLVASTHFASFLLGLELLSVSLYPLISYRYGSEPALEAGLKYLVLAGVSSAFLLFGMALIYTELGTLQFEEVAARLSEKAGPILVWAGMGLMMVGFGFKLGLVPFHLWTPDVYQGAPAPVAGYIATISKGAMFALLLRYFAGFNYQQNQSLVLAFVILAVGSMVLGNLLGLFQRNVKRLLAYSSIAHLGYLLVAFLASGPLVPVAVSFYLVAYFVTTLGAFGIIALLSKPDRDAESLEEYQGLAWRRPWVTAAFTAMLLSLAGIPFSAGFIGKFYVLAAGAGSGLWWLIILMVVTSAIGLFYYLRVVIAMYQSGSMVTARPILKQPLALASGVVLIASTILLFWLGIYPGPLLDFLQATVGLGK